VQYYTAQVKSSAHTMAQYKSPPHKKEEKEKEENNKRYVTQTI